MGGLITEDTVNYSNPPPSLKDIKHIHKCRISVMKGRGPSVIGGFCCQACSFRTLFRGLVFPGYLQHAARCDVDVVYSFIFLKWSLLISKLVENLKPSQSSRIYSHSNNMTSSCERSC